MGVSVWLWWSILPYIISSLLWPHGLVVSATVVISLSVCWAGVLSLVYGMTVKSTILSLDFYVFIEVFSAGYRLDDCSLLLLPLIFD